MLGDDLSHTGVSENLKHLYTLWPLVAVLFNACATLGAGVACMQSMHLTFCSTVFLAPENLIFSSMFRNIQ